MDAATVHGLHLLFVVFLCAATAADVFYLRSKQAAVIQPKELLDSWRTRVGLTQMFLFILVIVMGLMMWLPSPQSFSPAIFHSKMGLAVVYLVLGKVRMLKERRTKVAAVGITRLSASVLLVILCLGIYGGLHV